MVEYPEFIEQSEARRVRVPDLHLGGSKIRALFNFPIAQFLWCSVVRNFTTTGMKENQR
jgi:hypothetical protein